MHQFDENFYNAGNTSNQKYDVKTSIEKHLEAIRISSPTNEVIANNQKKIYHLTLV